MGKSLSFLNKVLKKKTHIFIFSDFLNSSFEKPMKILSQKHDVINLIFSDIFEKEIPPLGLVDIEDLETEQQITVDFSSPILQKEFKISMNKKIEKRNKEFAQTQCEQIFIDCQKDIYQPLITFFHKRIKTK